MALTASEILLIIKAKDEASKALEKITGSSNKLDLSLAGLTKTLGLVGVGLGAMVGMVGASIAAMGGLATKAAMAAGRVEELAIVNEVLARNAGLSQQFVREAAESVRDKGIEAAVAEQAVAKLIQADLDLAKASDLARVAQDAAVISNSNSSEAFDALIHGITTYNPLVLRNQGIIVDTTLAYEEYGAEIGKAATELTTAEKQAAMFNAVLKAGGAIAGAYDAAMQNPIKQLGSLKRLFNDIAVGAGESFLRLFSRIIRDFSNWVSWLGEAVAKGGELRPVIERLAQAFTAVYNALEPIRQWAERGFAIVAEGIMHLFSGLLQTLAQLVNVATATVRAIAQAMGIDMDVLADGAQSWGENVVVSFAQGMANAVAYVIRVLNSIGQIITYWLQPGSPPRLLPKIGEWGRGAIQAYLDGMGEGIDYATAKSALEGIQRFFELELRPLNDRMRAISRERADILGAMELEELEMRLAGGFVDPRQQRLVELRMEELELAEELRDVEAEKDEAIRAAQDILFPLEQQLDLTKKLAGATKGVADATGGIADALDAVTQRGFAMEDSFDKVKNTLTDDLGERIEAIFAPVVELGTEMGETWGGAFDLISERLAPLSGKLAEARDLALAFWAGVTGQDIGEGRTVEALKEERDFLVEEKERLEDLNEEWALATGQPGKYAEAIAELEVQIAALTAEIERQEEAQQKATKAGSLIARLIKWWWTDPIREYRQAWADLGTAWDDLVVAATPLIEAADTIATAVEDVWKMLGVDADSGQRGAWKSMIEILGLILNPFEKATLVIEGLGKAVDLARQAIEKLVYWWDKLLGIDSSDVPGVPATDGVSRFASGADFVTRGPQLMLVGEAGREHVQVTPLSRDGATDNSSREYHLHIHTNAATEPILADFRMMEAWA